MGRLSATAYSFPIGSGDNMIGKVHLDLRSKLGVAVGFDTKFKYGKDDRSYGNFVSYYADDTNPDNGTNGRYRVSFQHRLFITDDIYATADINLLSDSNFLETYYPYLFRVDPQPDTFVSVTKWDEFYTLNLIARWQINDFQDTTERLPELVFDFKQHRLFGLPVYYDGESSVGEYRRSFPTTPTPSPFPDYNALRFDTFHQISFPNQFFGWLNVTPRAGFRLTYYSDSGTFLSSSGSFVEIDPVTGFPRL